MGTRPVVAVKVLQTQPLWQTPLGVRVSRRCSSLNCGPAEKLLNLTVLIFKTLLIGETTSTDNQELLCSVLLTVVIQASNILQRYAHSITVTN